MIYSAVLFDFGGTIGGSSGIPSFVQSLIKNLYRSGYRIGVISNSHRYGDAYWLRQELAELNLIEFIEVVCGSGGMLGEISIQGSAGCHKPDANIYQRACNFLNVPFDRCVFVGDSWDADIVKPASLGMACLHVDVNKEDYSDRLWELLKDNPKRVRPNVITTYQVLSTSPWRIACRLRDLTEPIAAGDLAVVGMTAVRIMRADLSHDKNDILDTSDKGRQTIVLDLSPQL